MKKITGFNILRLYAMTLIVVYHVLRTDLPGGFVAVEMFFVLSGFLIASKLLSEYKIGNKVSFWKFLWSRIKKFYPAMLACVILTLTLGYFVNLDLMTRARSNTLYAMTFSTNIADIVNGTSYETQIMPNVFQHFWFLALILQAYIIIFVLLKIAMNWSKNYRQGVKTMMMVSGLIFAISYTLMAIFGGHYGLIDRAYFGPDTHIGGFFLGVLLASTLAARKKQLKPAKTVASRIGWTILLVSMITIITILAFLTNYNNLYVFYFELMIVAVMTFVMILAILKIQKKKWSRIIIILEYLGGLTFYIYLFHWPLFILLPTWLDVGQVVLAIVVSCGSVILAFMMDKIVTPIFSKLWSSK